MLLSPQSADFLSQISAKVVYGTIIAMAVLEPMSYSLPRSEIVIFTEFISMLAVVLAGTFSEKISAIMKQRQALPYTDLWPIFIKQAWVMAGMLAPLLFFGLSMTGFFTQEKALLFSEFTLEFILLSFGFLSRRLCGGSLLQSLAYGILAALVGLILVNIKLWAKYLPEIGQ